MATYVMLGSYSVEAIARISAARTKAAAKIIGDCDGQLKAAYVLLGDVDILLVTEFPGIEKAMKASVTLSRQLGIAFKTAAAVSVEEFDRLVAGK